MKALFKLVLIVLLAMPFVMYAQDTTPVMSAEDLIPGVITIPTWLQTLISFIVVAAPAIQFVLKRTPTPYSVKIGGWLGKLLDIITFFQPDKKDNGGNHN